MLMRAYAFTGRNRRVLVLLGTGYLSLVGVDIWVFCTRVEIPPPILYMVLNGTGCFPNYGAGVMGLRIGYSMLAAILMDLLSLVVVVVYCVKSKWKRDVSLARYFVSQGLTAFAFVMVINIATAITYFRILDLRNQVTPTDTVLARRHSCIVDEALDLPPGDSWVIKPA
ncbi:hypothetical protein CVT25_011541 [Psilocybe cyanescens]|uniref:Uncharacterized protein n=1 Tax=Psilocybe cyanescens TaxID=93625 RepID=A0A409XCN6_PSICY|nr:hypothetical protein CVT25_011541 [Psilocybe cyanescens]